MAKRIIDMVLERKAQIVSNPNEALKNAALAVAAIHGGIKSSAWESYMLQFVDKDSKGVVIDPDQLKRLLATDQTLGDPGLDAHRAYLIGNAVCGAGTPAAFENTVDSIDQTLSDPCA